MPASSRSHSRPPLPVHASALHAPQVGSPSRSPLGSSASPELIIPNQLAGGKTLLATIADFAAESGAIVTELPQRRAWRLLQSWREIYCEPVRRATGKWVPLGSCAWHTFSHGFYPYLRGRRALIEYRKQIPTNLLALAESDAYSAISFSHTSPIDFSPLGIDVYIGPIGFEWTIVFTHERGYGPYFATQ